MNLEKISIELLILNELKRRAEAFKEDDGWVCARPDTLAKSTKLSIEAVNDALKSLAGESHVRNGEPVLKEEMRKSKTFPKNKRPFLHRKFIVDVE